MRRISWSPVADVILFTIAIGSAVWLMYTAMRPQSPERGMLNSVMQGDPPELLRKWRLMDPVVRAAFPETGNVVASYSGLSPGNQSDELIASMFHYRTTYLAWPRRMFMAGPDTTLNTGEAVISSTRPSDPDWLRAHDITGLVELRWQDGALVVVPRQAPGASP